MPRSHAFSLCLYLWLAGGGRIERYGLRGVGREGAWNHERSAERRPDRYGMARGSRQTGRPRDVEDAIENGRVAGICILLSSGRTAGIIEKDPGLGTRRKAQRSCSVYVNVHCTDWQLAKGQECKRLPELQQRSRQTQDPGSQ